jgi:glutamine amidotransferase
MRATVFDYGAGNLHSLAKALAAGVANVVIEAAPLRALDTDVLVLPGVGAFGAAVARLDAARERMRGAIQAGLPCIGICLGMQLLFETSDEAGPNAAGIGVLAGRVTRLQSRRVPQIGWNSIEYVERMTLDQPLGHAYYANSYVCRPADPAVVWAWSRHENDRFPAIVRSGRTIGVQFHPEKSSEPGVRFLHAILAEATS